MKFFRESGKIGREQSGMESRKLITSDISKKFKNVYRNKKIAKLDSYFNNEQYDDLQEWESKTASIYHKKPKLIFPFAKNLSSRLASKLIGNEVFPEFKIDDMPDDDAYVKAIVKLSDLKTELLEPMRKVINAGSGFLRFRIVNGKFDFTFYDSKFCYPEFSESGDLEKVVYKYVYEDETERDHYGNRKKKWYKIEFGSFTDILFDNPSYDEAQTEDPEFTEVEVFDHGIGFVQGVWLSTSKTDRDGFGLCEDLLPMIDELCYSLSLSSRSVSYNQDPQLMFKNLDDDFISNLVRSVTKSWNLGRDGEASFLESEMTGVKEASGLRDKVKGHISDLTRVTLLDPEKLSGAAQSGRAMEILHGPLVDLVSEYRSIFETQFKELLTKLSIAVLIAKSQGVDSPVMIPEGYRPQSLDITILWPPIFKMTLEDMKSKIGLAVQASTANIISRKTATNYIKEIFSITDIDAEHAEIAAQPVFNPFGGF